MEWSQKRKTLFVLVFAGAVILLVAYPAYLLTHRTPTCFDQKQNGTETGIDCGGGCALACLADIKAPLVVWAKAFYLGGPYYDLGAYVENPNTESGVKSVRYAFRVFDREGKVLVEKKGVTEIVPGAVFVLFEPNIVIAGNPDRVEVSFDQGDLSRWIKARVSSSIIVPKNQNLKNTDTKPRFEAVLMNTDLVNSVANLTVSAIIYDAQRSPVAISRTFVDNIQKGGEESIFFTWPSRFAKDTERESGSGNFITEIVATPRAVFAKE